MINERTKREQDLTTKLIHASNIYITMYGLNKRKDKILKIKTTEINKFVFDWYGQGPGFIYLWGWPGPDGNIYLLSDYGETWAFTRKELEEYKNA